ncbi:hypothetical protein LUZ61_012887 [Rhynchospora tenuis]|uniref:SWIM-type domain-containing protein n=1 Tax=Rhynchospora tenuis TaxID=198213 RepID=A0AAD6F1J6_9POAL|nr:hypothetical protein LUZ61_012887 [Rhynchospora tenuis]
MPGMEMPSDPSSEDGSVQTIEASSSDTNDNSLNQETVGHGNNALASELPQDRWPHRTEPEVGMLFCSEEQAYQFYNQYAHRKGFSVRKGHLGRRKDGTVRNRHFLCSNEGTRQKHRTHITKKPRDTVRTNCMARIEFKVSRENTWVVSKVIYDHNHPLVRPHKAHLLRSHRRVEERERSDSEPQEFPIEEVQEAENIGFNLKDQTGYLHTNRMRDLQKGEAQFLLDFLNAKKLEDPCFFYSVQLDDREQVTNFFWADSRSILDYSYFGDVVLFDTTYRSSRNELPIAVFLGISHHKHIVVFGTALLLDETTESFVWLFKTFLEAMSRKQPKTIFADEWSPVERAIGMVLSDCAHRLCLWHLTQNVLTNISQLCSSEPIFLKDFKNWIFDRGSTEDDFHQTWAGLNSKYNLSSNSWIQDVYAVRGKWASVYQHDTFCASMTSYNWCEVLKSFFKRYFTRKQTLSKFIELFQKVLIKLREKELYEDHKSRQTRPVLLVDIPMLVEASNSYTRVVYAEFEEEFKNQLQCICQPISMNGPDCLFRVSLPGNKQFGIVELNSSNLEITCSCKKFQASGLLCMHALKVFSHNNILHLPTRYILKRWTKDATSEVVPEYFRALDETTIQEPLKEQYDRVWQKAVSVILKSVCSEDGQRIFENEINRLNVEVKDFLSRAPQNRGSNAEHEDVHGVKRKKRIGKRKGEGGNKRKEMVSPQNNMSEVHSGIARGNEEQNRVMDNESSSQIYCNQPIQEGYVAPQGMYDQPSNNLNIMSWFNSKGGSVCVSLPNFINWSIPSCAAPPNVAMPHHTLDLTPNSALPNPHHSVTRKLSFDINKGLRHVSFFIFFSSEL